jgi:aspartyl aminopeptidase
MDFLKEYGIKNEVIDKMLNSYDPVLIDVFLFDEGNVNFQTAEIGKVDQGGGGTIAYILGNLNMDVIDAGIPVLNMHAPMEIVSKVDLYEAYLGYKAFLKA